MEDVMDIFLMYLLFAVGVVLIIKGGDWFVDGAAWIADASGIPKFIVGATIVSFATTMPELIVSCLATANGSYEMAAGNAIGSVTANTALIMAISLIFIPSFIDRKKYMVKSVLMLLAIVLLGVSCLGGSLSIWATIPVLAVFVVFIIENIKSAKEEVDPSEERPTFTKGVVAKNIIMLIVGAAAIVLGSQLLVNYGEKIALSWGVSEAIISLTLVAIGTSLPELVTTVSAIIKKQPSLSVGNIVGANIIDMTMILPICSLISGGSLIVEKGTYMLDIPAAFICGAIALIPALIRKKFSRVQGAILLVCYAAYLALRICMFG